MTGWGDGISNMLNTGFELNGNVYAKKTLPSVADNLSKVWRTHTTKFGFYWERTWNEQPGNGPVNGSMVFAPWGGGHQVRLLLGAHLERATWQWSCQWLDGVCPLGRR